MAVMNVKTGDFEEKVLKAELPVLVDFWADWCGPCKMLSPIVHEIGEEAEGFLVAAVNADESPELLSRYGVRAIPTLVVFKNGEVVKQSTGFIPKEQVLDLLK